MDRVLGDSHSRASSLLSDLRYASCLSRICFLLVRMSVLSCAVAQAPFCPSSGQASQASGLHHKFPTNQRRRLQRAEAVPRMLTSELPLLLWRTGIEAGCPAENNGGEKSGLTIETAFLKVIREQMSWQRIKKPRSRNRRKAKEVNQPLEVCSPGVTGRGNREARNPSRQTFE